MVYVFRVGVLCKACPCSSKRNGIRKRGRLLIHCDCSKSPL